MKNYIFAIMIAIAVVFSAPVNSQSTTTCGFEGCKKSFEISVSTSGQKIFEFVQCYNAAWLRYNGEVEKARSKYWYCIGTAAGTGASIYAACKTGIWKSAGFIDWLKKKLPRFVPLACETKALAAGASVEVYCGWEYLATMDALCIDLDVALALCANEADPNFKQCNL